MIRKLLRVNRRFEGCGLAPDPGFKTVAVNVPRTDGEGPHATDSREGNSIRELTVVRKI